MNLYIRIIVVVYLAFQAAPMAFGQQPAAHKYGTMNDALSALNRAADDNEREKIIKEMLVLPLDAPAQVVTMYNFAADLENKVTSANAREYLGFTNAICNIIMRATDAQFANVLAVVLDKEFSSLPWHFLGQYSALTNAQRVRSEMRELRLDTLTGVIGRTKDRQALPVLRRMLENDGSARDAAIAAIGQIGDPADLDDLIRRIKKDPKAQITVTSFGPSAFDRIMQEIDDPAVSEDVKDNLQSSIQYMLTSGNKEKFLKLLDHPNNVVRELASGALCRGAKPGDEDTIIKLAHSTLGATRLEAVGAMGKIWSDKLLPTATDMLLHDTSPGIRSEVAIMLGSRKDPDAIPGLKAALNDKDPYVRECVQSALNKIR